MQSWLSCSADVLPIRVLTTDISTRSHQALTILKILLHCVLNNPQPATSLSPVFSESSLHLPRTPTLSAGTHPRQLRWSVDGLRSTLDPGMNASEIGTCWNCSGIDTSRAHIKWVSSLCGIYSESSPRPLPLSPANTHRSSRNGKEETRNLNRAKRRGIQASNLTAGRKDAGRRASGGGIALGRRSRSIS
jgi:hypothetical protein